MLLLAFSEYRLTESLLTGLESPTQTDLRGACPIMPEDNSGAMCEDAGAEARVDARVVDLMAEAEAAGARYPAEMNIWGEARPVEPVGLALSGARKLPEGAA